jgi:hypothetical protein
MRKVEHYCRSRSCRRVTIQLVRIVTDQLPYGVEVIQCIKCSNQTIALIKPEEVSQ